MKKYTILKYVTYITLVVLVVLLFFTIFSVGSQNQFEVDRGSVNLDGCERVIDESELEFDACYDAFSKQVFFEVNNKEFFDSETRVRASFFDYSQSAFELAVPGTGESSFVSLDAERNPLSLEVYLLSQVKDYCTVPLDLRIDFCPRNVTSSSQNNSISLISQVDVAEFTKVEPTATGDSIASDLVDAEQVWEAICASDWDCSSWDSCQDGTQKRSCVDKNRCAIPTSVPKRVRSCEALCEENWKCTWSRCTNGFTTPSCVDENACGTENDKPKEIACRTSCEPDIVCGEWSSCAADYDFLTLQGSNADLNGKQLRTCVDMNGCNPNLQEERSCSLEVDVYTRGFTKCGKQYIGIYDALNRTLLANVEKTGRLDLINIDLSGEKSRFECDYCFDGLLNGDEEQVDCGGSCAPCESRVVFEDYSKNAVQKFFDSLFSFFR